jgi:hypothetical protein
MHFLFIQISHHFSIRTDSLALQNGQTYRERPNELLLSHADYADSKSLLGHTPKYPLEIRGIHVKDATLTPHLCGITAPLYATIRYLRYPYDMSKF